jgi:DNA ligase (NAD+)
MARASITGTMEAMQGTPDTTRKSYLEKVAAATAAAAAYYDSDTLLMSDADYDRLLADITATEAAKPQWRTEHGLLTTVAAGRSKGGEARHAVPMLSLDNVFNAEELEAWLAARPDVTHFTVEPKFDGLSLGATYRNGILVRLATRGDGETGEDVTYAVARIAGLPSRLSDPVDVEVRGEVIFTHDNYDAANAGRIASGKKAFVNPRNAAAGTLRAETLDYPVELSFFAHGQHGLTAQSHHDVMARLSGLGVNVGNGDLGARRVARTELIAVIDAFGTGRTNLPLDVDGAVIKVDSLETQTKMGMSSRAPRWGIAYKYPAAEATSTLLSVEWTVGRTGRITPRATIDPVFVSGTTVTNATLHNADDIKRKDLRIGDRVLVKRAGEVIPRIEAPLVDLRDGSQTAVDIPQSCPRCHGQIDTTDAVWRCVRGRACGASESIMYAVGRDALDIEGMGEKVVVQLVERGLVADVADLFSLSAAQLAELDRMGEKSAVKIVEQIEQARTRPLSRVLCALGVRMTGRSMSRRLARHFSSMDAIAGADVETLCKVEGVGPERAQVIAEELRDLADVIEKLRAAGVNLLEADSGGVEATSALVGKTFVVTGSMSGPLAGMSRDQVHELIEQAGGKTSGSVSKKTDYLVTGDGGGSKAVKATELGVATVSPDDLAAMLGVTA